MRSYIFPSILCCIFDRAERDTLWDRSHSNLFLCSFQMLLRRFLAAASLMLWSSPGSLVECATAIDVHDGRFPLMDSQSREAVVLHSRGLHGRLHAVQVFLVYTQECIREQLTGLIPADRASFVSCISQGSENPPTAKTDWILDIMHSLFEGVGEERTQFLRSAIEWIDLGISGDVLMDNARTYVAAAVGRLRAKEQSVLIENELVRWERDPWALVPNRVASVDLVALTSRFGVCAPRTRLGMAARIASARTEEAIRLTIDWLVSFCWKDLVDLARLFATGEVVEAREHSWFVALVRRLAVERTNAAMGLLRARRAFVAMDIPLIDDALARSVVMDLTESLRALPSAPELIGGELRRWQTNPFLVSWGAKDSVEVLRACLSREEGILVRQWGQSVAVQIRDAAALCAREAIAVQSDDVVNEAFWFPVERFTLAAVSFVEPGLVAAVRFIEEKSLPLSADPGFAYVRRAAFTPSGTDDEKSGRHADEIELRTLLHDRDYETMLGERGVCPPASFLAGGDAVSLAPGPSITGTEAKVAFTSDGRFVVKTLLVAGRNSMSKRLFGALSRERGVHETIGDL